MIHRVCFRIPEVIERYDELVYNPDTDTLIALPDENNKHLLGTRSGRDERGFWQVLPPRRYEYLKAATDMIGVELLTELIQGTEITLTK